VLKYQASLTRVPAVSFSKTGAQEPSTPTGMEWFPKVEHFRSANLSQFMPSAQHMQSVEMSSRRAADEDRDLDGIVVSNGAHAPNAVVQSLSKRSPPQIRSRSC